MCGDLRRKRPQSLNLPPLQACKCIDLLINLTIMTANLMCGNVHRKCPQSLNLPPLEACKCIDFTSKSENMTAALIRSN